ncbi:IS3 family transposase, partial [Polynucleobacter sp. Fuers-14]|uniref:IS3 family transposase n=1 Tax=Polynucleobacter sp. Fuers-14 TaxID=1758364 RepID=UPI002103D152
MSKYSTQFKLKVVKEYLKFGGLRRIANLHEINTSDIRNWTLAYQTHGLPSLKKRALRQYTPQFKLSVLRYMKNNQTSIRPTAAHFNIAAPSSISVWQRLYNEGGIAALQARPKGRVPMPKPFKPFVPTNKPVTQMTQEELIQELEYRRVETDYPKKARSLSPAKALGKQEQAQVITELRRSYPLQVILTVVGMPRSVYYYQVSASLKPDTYLDTKMQIKTIFHAHKGRYGYRRVQTALSSQSCYLNHKTVQKLMAQLGIKSTVRPKRYQSYKGALGKVAPNLLERKFVAKAPNQKWVTDVTEFKIKGEKVYLSPILDLYNGEIVSYEIADRPQISMVMQMLQKAFKQLKPKDKPILHSDQGWQYQMRFYQEALKEQGLTQSMSRKGNCLDNAVMENWFGIMKSEFFYQEKFETIESFKAELEEYIHYYNHDR